MIKTVNEERESGKGLTKGRGFRQWTKEYKKGNEGNELARER